MQTHKDRFENPWTEKEIAILRPHAHLTPSAAAKADPKVRKLLATRSIGAVGQRIYRLRAEAAEANGTHATDQPTDKPKRKPQRKKILQPDAPRLAYCPSCGCNLRAIQAALSIQGL